MMLSLGIPLCGLLLTALFRMALPTPRARVPALTFNTNPPVISVAVLRKADA